jgi:hypothetical protein
LERRNPGIQADCRHISINLRQFVVDFFQLSFVTTVIPGYRCFAGGGTGGGYDLLQLTVGPRPGSARLRNSANSMDFLFFF